MFIRPCGSLCFKTVKKLDTIPGTCYDSDEVKNQYAISRSGIPIWGLPVNSFQIVFILDSNNGHKIKTYDLLARKGPTLGYHATMFPVLIWKQNYSNNGLFRSLHRATHKPVCTSTNILFIQKPQYHQDSHWDNTTRHHLFHF